MEICQHCGMYMKPIKLKLDSSTGFRADCEFCGKAIAVSEVREDGKHYWKKVKKIA